MMKATRISPNTTDCRPAGGTVSGSQPFAIDIPCGSMMMNAAPSTAPCNEPTPPMITMVTSSIDWISVNCSGEMKPTLCAYRAPPTPVSAAESANDMVL